MRAFALTLLFAATAMADTSIGRGKPPAATVLSYTAPTGDKPDDAAIAFTELQPGQVVYDCLGVEWTVIEAQERGREGSLVNRWYLVIDGVGNRTRKFGGHLTSLRLQRDLDGDGRPETVLIFFGGDFQIQVRVVGVNEPLVLPAAGGAYLSQKGGNASLAFVDAKLTGLPLVRVDSKPEACADWSETYVSFVDGKLRVALAVSGLTDPPVFATPKVKFDAHARTAVVTLESVEEDDRGRRHRSRAVTHYTLEDGVYREVTARRTP
jgi:hypothetical protein